MIALLWILALMLPKAGTYVGEVPVTVASIAVVAYGAYYFAYGGFPRRRVAEAQRFTRYYLVYIWALVLSALANVGTLDVTDFTSWILLVGSPVAFYAGLRAKNPRRLIVIVLIATCTVGVYGLAQNLFGVEETAVPGVTHVLGEDLINDNPIRTPSGTLKSPSTYHNGNLAASFLLIGFGFALFASRVNTRLRALAGLALCSAFIGVAVSLARAAAIGFAVAAVIALAPMYRPPWIGRRIARLATSVLLLAGVLLLGYVLTGSETFLFERYIVDSVEDPTGAGRTDGYAAWFSLMANHPPDAFMRVLAFGDGRVDLIADQLEGVPAIIGKYGLLVLVALGALLLLPIRMIRSVQGSAGTVVWFGFVASAGMWLIDNTFLYPPTLMNWFLLAGLAVQISLTTKLDDPQHLLVSGVDSRQLELAT